jgi:hypothetical protein
MTRIALAFALLALLACNRTANRAQWRRMSAREKTLYVRALLGHEAAKKAKGGNDLRFPQTPEQYVRAIDAAYARGDRRSVDDVFESLAAK